MSAHKDRPYYYTDFALFVKAFFAFTGKTYGQKSRRKKAKAVNLCCLSRPLPQYCSSGALPSSSVLVMERIWAS